MENLQNDIIETNEAQEAQAMTKEQKPGFVARILHRKDQLMKHKTVRRVVTVCKGAVVAGACWLSYKAGVRHATPVTVEVKEALPETAAGETEEVPETIVNEDGMIVDKETGEVLGD